MARRQRLSKPVRKDESESRDSHRELLLHILLNAVEFANAMRNLGVLKSAKKDTESLISSIAGKLPQRRTRR
jgi:hypothetical protein